MGKYNRRTVLAAASAIAALHGAGMAAPRARRPNILLILADDWSWQPEDDKDRFALRLPTFTRIAREGMVFRHAFAASPSCTASRGALLTGQWPWRLAEGANLASILPRRFDVYPDLLERAGYHVGYARKGWGPGQIEPARRARNPAGNAYDDMAGFLDARPADAPFCFWFGSHDPHRPYVRGEGIRSGISPASVTVPPYLPDTAEVRSDMVDYRFEIERLDREAGELLARLERDGLLDDTIVVMTGDNGWPFPRGKATLYDAGWHVPLAMMWKGGMTGGRTSDAMISLTDLAPTFLALAGVAKPAAMTGQSLMPLLGANRALPRDHVIGMLERHMDGRTVPGQGYPVRAFRTASHLYIRNFHPERWPAGNPSARKLSRHDIETRTFAGYADIDGSPTKAVLVEGRDDPAIARFQQMAMGKRPAEELYDIRADPYALHNLAAEPAYAALLKRLGARLLGELRATGDPRALGNGDIFDDYPSYSDPGFGRPPAL